MKSCTASLLLASLGLTAALPTAQNSNRQQEVTITALLGNGDSATAFGAQIGATTETSGLGVRSARSSLFRDRTWCGGFKDAGATNLWLNFDGTDGIFSTGKDAIYSEACSSGFCAQGAATVGTASYWCADSLEAVQRRVQQRTLPPNGRLNNGGNGGNAPTPPPVNNGGNNNPAPAQPSAPAASAVTVQILFGDGDGATTRQALVGETTVTGGVGSALSSTSAQNTFCAGFKDAGASNIWLNFDGTDGIFSAGKDAVYSEACNSAFCGDGARTVSIASFWCDTSIQGVQNRIKERTLPPNGRIGGGNGGNNGNTPPPVNNPATPAAPPANEGGATANLQIETERQTTFFVETVAITGTPQQTRNKAAISITLQSADLPEGVFEEAVQCQVLGANGQVIASLDALNEAVLTTGSKPVSFASVQCEIVA